MKSAKPLYRFLPLLIACAVNSATFDPADYEQRKAKAEKAFAEGSYARAEQAFSAIDTGALPKAERRWIEFRIHDSAWRSEASTHKADNTRLNAARSALEKMIRDQTEPDRIYAEICESLGDFRWTNARQRSWYTAWQNYQRALDWWAGSPDIELARQRYIRILKRIVTPGFNERYYYYGYYGNYIPEKFARDFLEIAKTDEDKAHASYVMAMNLLFRGGNQEKRALAPDHFEAALKIGKRSAWYDDALFYYAQWMRDQGRIMPQENGGWTYERDYVKAVEIYRRLLREFREGETRHYRQAKQQIANITGVSLNVGVSHIFLPGSEIQYHLNWRNTKSIDLALYPIDTTADIPFKNDASGTRSWVNSLRLGRSMHSWKHDTKDEGKHVPGSAQLRIEKQLESGAYVLEAKSEGLSRRELVLITDSSLVLKSNGRQALIYFCNAADGKPIANARTRLWARHYANRKWHTRTWTARTDKDGLARLEVTRSDGRSPQLLATAIKDDQQAYSTGNTSYYNRNHQVWRIYAHTDRPAYRPEEKVEWKIIARTYDGSGYHTPSEAKVHYEIRDPRGNKVHEATVSLNEFGSAWSSFDLKKDLPLGEYRIQFLANDQRGRRGHVGSATLFRLEEYKLPEFKVSVQTPEEDGRKKVFRVGERVEAEVQADYYFGGPVAGAKVEVIIRQKKHYRYWPQPRSFPWFYEDIDQDPHRYYGRSRGSQIKREVLTTDDTGKVKFTFDTPQGANTDYEYVIEARVTDQSRREIVGTGSVKVTRQRYFVNARPEHNIYRPQDKAVVGFKAKDANGAPFEVSGEVVVTRDYWWEIWIDPNGREVQGPELRRLKSQPIFPPRPAPGKKGWKLKFRGYQHDEVTRQMVQLNAEGEGEFSFTPERDGYYRVNWKSEDVIRENPRLAKAITASTTVYVCSSTTTDIGYRHGGVQIIVDKDTFRVGERAPVMLMAPTNDRYVLFATEGEDLYSYQLVHVTGTVKLVQLDISEREVPNFFLSATMVHDRKIHQDAEQVIVPPTKNFLNVDIVSNQDEYQPREEGELTVKTTDHNGKPVAAEVSLGLVDESVYYIQSDYAMDPRKFYFGRKRANHTRNMSTFNHRSYVKLVYHEESKQVMTEDAAKNLRKQAKDSPDELSAEEEADSVPASGPAAGVADGRPQRLRAFQSASVASTPAPATAKPKVPGNAMARDSALGPEMAKEGAVLSKRAAKKYDQVSAQVQVRSDFRSTVIWQPDVKTDRNGEATVKLKFPDSLTGWKATARAVGKRNTFGIGTSATRTRQPLIVRLQAPRFFVTGDRTVVSAVINNNTKKRMSLKAVLEVGGAQVIGYLLDGPRKGLNPVDGFNVMPYAVEHPIALVDKVSVPANSEKRVDWLIQTPKPGDVKLKVTAFTGNGKSADAMQRSYSAHEHGIEKFVSKSGKVRGNNIRIKLDIPKERKNESTQLTVQVTPSMAVTMLDALPYLIDYPYGCTEQTMSRFLPAAITARTMKDLGLEPEDIMGRVFGGIEQAHVDKTQPKGKKNLEELDEMVAKGLKRLYDFQHSDGGWGWWKKGTSDHWMTAYVVWGLNLANQAGVTVKSSAASRGAHFLDKRLVEEELNPDMQAWMLHALALHKKRNANFASSNFQKKAFDNLWNKKDQLNAYTRALFALAAHNYGRKVEARTLVRNLENGVITDDRPDTSVLIEGQPKNKGVMGTAHWGNDGIYWRWSEGGVEATAFALRALLTISPKNKLIEPVTNWLIKNRRGAQWSNTRDTAIVVLAMNDYLRTSGELKADMEYEVLVNGKRIAKKKIAGADLFNAPSRFTVNRELIRDGNNDIRIRRTVEGPIYFAAEAEFFSLENPIPAAGNEIFVKRDYYRLAGRPTLLKGYVYDKVKLHDGDTIKSGERIETVLTVDAKNHYEYLLFEDLKPAGFEAVQIRSGQSLYAKELNAVSVNRKFAKANYGPYHVQRGDTLFGIARKHRTKMSEIQALNPKLDPRKLKIGQQVMVPGLPPLPQKQRTSDYTGRSRWIYQELRDRKVAMFIDKLREGIWEIRYDLRAEVPGKFHALPVLGHAMYAPEIRCNSDEIRVTVRD